MSFPGSGYLRISNIQPIFFDCVECNEFNVGIIIAEGSTKATCKDRNVTSTISIIDFEWDIPVVVSGVQALN